MTGALLDASALIALVEYEHVDHDAVARWFAAEADVACCPIAEGALVRHLVRNRWLPRDIALVLRALRSSRSLAFLPAGLSYADVDLAAVAGHRDVTDAYLVGLARASGRVLATLDRRLAAACPDAAALIA